MSQADAHIRTAESALSNDNFNVAVPLLNKALLIITESGGKDTKSALACHQKLGECCYQKGDYEDACAHYRECKRIIDILDQVSPETVVLVQQKLSKTLEKAQRFSEAKEASNESLELATELLEPGHPLIPVAYRMHLTLLQKTNATSKEIEFIETQMKELEKMPVNKVEVSDEVTDHVNYLTGSFNLDNIEKQRQLRQARRKMASARSMASEGGRFALKPIGIVLVVLGLVGVGVGGFLIYSMSQNSPPAEKKEEVLPKPENLPDLTDKMKELVGKTYASADGLKSISIREYGIVEYKIGNRTKTLSWREGAPPTDLLSQIQGTFNNVQSYSIARTKQGFIDNDGTILYDEEAPDLIVVRAMKKVADLAKYYYSTFESGYPSKREHFNRLGPAVDLENPLGKGMKPEIRLRNFNKEEGQQVFDQTLKEFSSGKALFPEDGKARKHPGLIECMSLKPYDKEIGEEGISFLIRAYGTDGKFITGANEASVYVLAQENGSEVNAIEAENLTLPFDEKKSTVVHFILD